GVDSAEGDGRVLARPLVQIDLARAALAARTRLVERDVPVAPETQDLQIDPARVLDRALVRAAVLGDAGAAQARRKEVRVLRGDPERREDAFLRPLRERRGVGP